MNRLTLATATELHTAKRLAPARATRFCVAEMELPTSGARILSTHDTREAAQAECDSRAAVYGSRASKPDFFVVER